MQQEVGAAVGEVAGVPEQRKRAAAKKTRKGHRRKAAAA